MAKADKPHTNPDDVDPEEFLRALLNISPEDAEKVREDAGTKADDKGESKPKN